MIGKRKNIVRVEVRSAHICGTNVGLEIRLSLISAVDVGAEGKPCREFMRKRRSEVHILVVRAHIEILSVPPLDYKLAQGFLFRKMRLGCLNLRHLCSR